MNAGPVNSLEFDALRHMWSHGRDRDDRLVSNETIQSLCELISYEFGYLVWLLLGTSSGAGVAEWFDARSGRGPAR